MNQNLPERTKSLREDVFKKGMALLAAAFPSMSLIMGFYWSQLNDLDSDCFSWAIMEITRNQSEIYPNTNLSAVIRQKAELRRKHLTQTRTLESTRETDIEKLKRWKQERADQIPEGWTNLKNRLKGYRSCQTPAY